jgi:uncharacterized protein
MKIDVHMHLAGVGTQGSGCWLAPSFRSRPTFFLLRRWYGVTDEEMRSSIDQRWADLLTDLVRGSELDAAVGLGFDGVYRGDGSFDETRSQLVVPPSWCFEVARRSAGTVLPGPSVNPSRGDALERLEECIEGGAVLLKWLPAVQVIDPSLPRHDRFYRRMQEAGLPLLVHSGGGEATFRVHAPELQDLHLLERPLEEGVTVIVAHTAAPIIYSRDPNQIPLLRRFLDRYPKLWVDNSGMANPSRFTHLARFARDPDIGARTLFGSDFPVPSSPLLFMDRFGPRTTLRLQKMDNPLQRDVAIKRELGYPDATLDRAAAVLPGLERWRAPASL